MQPDGVWPFLLHGGVVRGRLVRVSETVTDILSRHAYPGVVSQVLAETVVLAVALADSLKYEGIFTLQASGDGVIRQLVADVTSSGDVRAYAGFDETVVAGLSWNREGAAALPLQRLLGTGYLAFTVDQGGNTDRYQGIVALEGASLSDCVHAYFRQSEQLETRIASATLPPLSDSVEKWRVGALMVQRMPFQEGIVSEEEDDLWRAAAILSDSVTSDELLSSEVSGERLLYRLFHAEALTCSTPRPKRFSCRCSPDRVLRVLEGASPEERKSMCQEDGTIRAQCQFCSMEYVFSADDLAVKLLPSSS